MNDTNTFYILLKKIGRLLLVSKLALIAMLVSIVVPMSAFEAHVVNVTAVIERPPCQVCEGGVTEMTLQYLGSETALVEVIQKKDGTAFLGNVNPGESFSFVGTGKDSKLGPEVTIFINGEIHTSIHTSCSQEIGPGQIYGDFEIIDAVSRDGGLICPLPPIEFPPCEECTGGVSELTLKYLGIGPAHVVIEQNKGDNRIVYDDFVNQGDELHLVGTWNTRLGTEIVVFIDEIEHVSIHTSCSDAINPGLLFGDFEVIDAVSRVGGPICPFTGDIVPLSNITEDDSRTAALELFSIPLSPTVTIEEGLITPEDENGTSTDAAQEDPVEENPFTFASSTDPVPTDMASTSPETDEEEGIASSTPDVEPIETTPEDVPIVEEIVEEESIEDPVVDEDPAPEEPAEETPTEVEPLIEEPPPAEPDPIVEEPPAAE